MRILTAAIANTELKTDYCDISFVAINVVEHNENNDIFTEGTRQFKDDFQSALRSRSTLRSTLLKPKSRQIVAGCLNMHRKRSFIKQ